MITNAGCEMRSAELRVIVEHTSLPFLNQRLGRVDFRGPLRLVDPFHSPLSVSNVDV